MIDFLLVGFLFLLVVGLVIRHFQDLPR